MPYAQLAMFLVKVLSIPGPYTLALDRTNWKVGAVDLIILMLAIGLSQPRDSGCLDCLVQRGQTPTPANERRSWNLP